MAIYWSRLLVGMRKSVVLPQAAALHSERVTQRLEIRQTYFFHKVTGDTCGRLVQSERCFGRICQEWAWKQEHSMFRCILHHLVVQAVLISCAVITAACSLDLISVDLFIFLNSQRASKNTQKRTTSEFLGRDPLDLNLPG